MDSNWHHSFSPQSFLKGINVEQLLSRNDAYAENRIDKLGKPCLSCGGLTAPGLLLNEGSYLCRPCFEQTSLIQYPEQYESLRRQHLVACEARSRARRSLIENSADLHLKKFANVACWLSCLLLFVHLGFIVVTVAIFFTARSFERAHIEKLREWDTRNPTPPEPKVRHFHDPLAVLTARDKMTLFIFDHWPGYPPFWSYLREVVLKADGERCQVTGCPSRLTLHIHHILPVSQGGAHSPSNLVALCDFHHALEPERGHERIWSDIKTRYFTLVREHSRANRITSGSHIVRPHLRRLELIKLSELHDLAQSYGFSCVSCGRDDLTFSLFSDRNVIEIECAQCSVSIKGPQQLTEETGPRLAEILHVTRNQGRWKARWDVLAERKDDLWGEWTKGGSASKKRKSFKQKRQQNAAKPVCPKCGSPMRLINPRPGDRWSSFWGCTKFKVTGCKGSEKYEA